MKAIRRAFKFSLFILMGCCLSSVVNSEETNLEAQIRERQERRIRMGDDPSVNTPLPEIKIIITDEIKNSKPETLEECFHLLDKMFANSTEAIKDMSKGEFSYETHFGLGMWIRNNWFRHGSKELNDLFTSKGKIHIDSTSGILLSTYYRRIKGEKFRFEEILINAVSK